MYIVRHAFTLSLAAVAFAGCENKNRPKDEAQPNAAKPADDLKPEPVGKDPSGGGKDSERPPATPPTPGNPGGLPAQPSPDPTPAADVKPPTAEDLAVYTKDLPGNGKKLVMKMETSMGTFNCELFADKAPMTVANWVGLATGKKPWLNPKTGNVERGKPFFDGITFHRVIPDFMIQGGDPLGQGFGGPGYNFNDEIWPGQHIVPGVLAMANAGVRGGHGTNGSQFFVMEGVRPDLDDKHTVFGKCNEIDLIKKIEAVPRGPDDKPNTPVTINKVTISKA